MRREERLKRIAHDCVYFKSNQPCQPHLSQCAQCRCEAYSPRSGKVLMIELSSPARVIQCSAVVRRLKSQDPNCQITFMTDYPELLSDQVDIAMTLDAGSLVCLQMDHFDVIYNFDLDRRACAMTNQISADRKKGFYLRQGNSMPLDDDSLSYYLQRIFPQTCQSQQSTPTPVQQLFTLAGLEYQLDKPGLTASKTNSVVLCEDEIAVGLFAGHSQADGEAWEWPEGHWLSLAKRLAHTGVVPLLLGLPCHDAMNRRLARKSEAVYPGPMNWRDLRATMHLCDVVVSVDESAVVLAGALQRQVIQLSGQGKESVTRDIFKGYADMFSGDGVRLADIDPDQVYESVINRISVKPEPTSSGLKRPADPELADLLSLINSRAETAQTRMSP